MNNESTTPTDQDVFDQWTESLTPEAEDAWMDKLAALARSRFGKAPASSTDLTPEAPSSEQGPKGLRLVR